MAKTRRTITAALPGYQRNRELWRRAIHTTVLQAADKAGVRYDPADLLEVVVLLFLTKAKRLLIHDVDNRLKDILDALQGRFGRSTSAHRLIVGPNFFALPESCMASGEFLYLHLDTSTGAVRNNATQSAGPRFALTDLAGVEFTAPLAACGRPVKSPGGSTRCARASRAR